MARSSKDIAKALRFDQSAAIRRLPPLVPRHRLAACLLGAGAWFGLARTAGESQYLPGPVTPRARNLRERCAHCP
jgi:hypothetical protein